MDTFNAKELARPLDEPLAALEKQFEMLDVKKLEEQLRDFTERMSKISDETHDVFNKNGGHTESDAFAKITDIFDLKIKNPLANLITNYDPHDGNFMIYKCILKIIVNDENEEYSEEEGIQDKQFLVELGHYLRLRYAIAEVRKMVGETAA